MSRASSVMVAALSLVLLHAPGVDASQYSCGSYYDNESHHVGYYGPGAISTMYNEGIAANVTIRRVDLCFTDTTSNNWGNSYVAMGDSDRRGWVQVGFERSFGDQLRHFGQFWDGNRRAVSGWSVFTRYSVGSPLAGETYAYSVRWAEECNCLRSYVNTTVWQSSDFNPWQQVWTEPFHFEAIAESRYKASDVPGYSVSPGPTLYSDVKLMNYAHSWYSLPCGTTRVNQNDARWNAASTACNHLRTYTLGAP